MTNVLVILPTYNEKENISTIIPALYALESSKLLPEQKLSILVVDDNSPDGTANTVKALQDKHPSLYLLNRQQKEGLGKAYIAGFKWAVAQNKTREKIFTKIIQMDADFSHPISEIPQLLRHSGKFDVVLGSRWIDKGGTTGWPWHRKVLSKVGNAYTRTILGHHLKDATGGFKCFNIKVLEQLDLDAISAKGYGFQVEVSMQCLKHGYTIFESPIIFKDRAFGQSKMSFNIILEAFLMMPALRRKLKSS